jgi:hypothetical protein
MFMAHRRGGTAAPALVPLALAGLVWLWYPLDGDQALFHLGARALADGGVYYLDFWDIKQPGIYWFYQVGDLVGLGDLGTRLLELALAGLAGLAAVRLAREQELRRPAQLAAPTVLLAPYLLLSHEVGVGQIESLVNPFVVLLLAACWPAPAGRPRSAGRWLLAGLAAGAVGLLKLLYLPVVLLVLAGALVAGRSGGWRRGVPAAAAAAAGTAVPLVAAAGYLVAHGATGVTLLTTVDLPAQVAALPGTHQPGQLRAFVTASVSMAIVLGPPALLALWTARRRGTGVRELTVLAAAALATALALPQMATPYRPLVVAALLGLPALAGLDVADRRLDRYRRARTHDAGPHPVLPARIRLAAGVVLAVLAVPLLRGPYLLVRAAPGFGSWALTDAASWQRDTQLSVDPSPSESAPVRDLIAPGTAIYVFGEPRIYRRLDARQAVAVEGWSAAMLPPVAWAELSRELRAARPAFVYVDHDSAGYLPGSAPLLDRALRADYDVVARTDRGVWYRAHSPGSADLPRVARGWPTGDVRPDPGPG